MGSIGILAPVTLLAAACAGAVSVPEAAPEENASALETIEPYTPYLVRRAAHRTRVRQIGPNEPREMPERPGGANEIVYVSAGLDLKAWLFVPPGAKGP